MRAAGNDMAVLVKTNMRDGFKGGMEIDEAVQVAKRLVQDGAHALVLSGGFVSKAPMYVMRGAMPIKSMTHYMSCWWLKYGVRMVGKWMIPTVPFKILLLNGTYHQKVIIDRPNIVWWEKTVTVRGLSWLKQPRHVPSRNIMDVR